MTTIHTYLNRLLIGLTTTISNYHHRRLLVSAFALILGGLQALATEHPASRLVDNELALTQTVIRLNAGSGSAYTDGNGETWDADGAFVSSPTRNSSKSFDVQGTTDDDLFLSYRYAGRNPDGTTADFTYDLPVDPDGTYELRLHFLEPFFGAPGLASGGTGKRVFDVSIEGSLVLNNYDINAEAPAATVVVESFDNLAAADGSLTILFHSETNNAIISAIELVEIDDTPPPTTAVRYNAGTGEYTDVDGNLWGEDNRLTTGSSRTGSKPIDVSGTPDDPLFRSYRYALSDAGAPGADFGYDIPVDANATHTINLYFVETYFGPIVSGGTGKRVFDVAIEGTTVLNNFDINAEATPGSLLVKSFPGISASDGIVSVTFQSDVNNAIISGVEVISSGSAPTASAIFTGVTPGNGTTNVSLVDPQVTIGVLTSDGYELDETTLAGNVKLFKVLSGNQEQEVPSNVNDTGGGDAVILTPSQPLEPLTTYRFRISGVEANRIGDFNDRITFSSFQSTFTTADVDDTEPIDLSGVSFTKITGGALGQGVADRFTSLVIGPDGKLYGASIAGQIKRWTMNPNGTLSNLEVLTPSLSASPHPVTGVTPSEPRLIIGLCFDPQATANNLVAYITHSAAVLSGGPEWDGKITRLSGPQLNNVQDLVIHLPRSTKDHLTNSIIAGPDGHLYFTQGSNSAGGAPDPAWGFRPERLLAAAALKLDLSKLPNNLPLSAFTTDNVSVINNAPSNSLTMSDGTYNPYAANSPLTIFASGVRNAYDLTWHTNGFLYIPTNGTAGNNVSSPNAPASAPWVPIRRVDGSIATDATIPALAGGETQKDWLFKASLHSYHGHPNALRGEFVLNHGGITYGGIPGMTGTHVDVEKYPNNLGPDPHYVEPAYDFGNNKSPNGSIEYRSDAFGGAMKGMLLVVRFSGQDDVMVMQPGPGGDILQVYSNVPGLENFDDPLDLVEDPATGNLYVAQYDRGSDENQQLVLLRANTGDASPLAMDYYFIDADTDEIVDGPIADGDVIDIAGVSQFSLNVENYPPGTERVNFNILSGTLAGYTKTEGVIPYALFGDSPRFDYVGRPIAPGDEFTMRIRSLGENGGILTEDIFNFSVSNGGNLRIASVPETIAQQLIDEAGGLLVYPNPVGADNLVHVMVNSELTHLAVEITDVAGKRHLSTEVQVVDGEFQLDLGSLPPSTYFLKATDGVKSVTKKILKQ